MQPLLECERCQNCYHPACLGPNYPKPNKRKKPWVSWPQWYFPQRARLTKKFQYALLSQLPWYVRKCQSKKKRGETSVRIRQKHNIKAAKWHICVCIVTLVKPHFSGLYDMHPVQELWCDPRKELGHRVESWQGAVSWLH